MVVVRAAVLLYKFGTAARKLARMSEAT